MSWVELQWDIPNDQIEVLSGKLFALGALGVQEDYRPGEEPIPLQPWDDPNTVVEQPGRLLIKAWWEYQVWLESRPHIERLAQLTDGNGGIRWVPVSQEDWANAWKQHFTRKVFWSKQSLHQ